jgi:hypothetical protein
MKVLISTISVIVLIIMANTGHAQETYAEKLGFPKGSKVIILHVDDVGMSWDSNQGAIEAIEKGVATSLSIMMPCPWVPDFMHYLKDHPNVDAGLHLTLTSEWPGYRWGPLSGKPTVPGLVDAEGAMWKSVPDVISNAKGDEVEKEIRAQIERSRSMGWNPTHMDSHMGTLFATPEFMMRYIKIGLEMKIPVMFPGGHNTMLGSTGTIPADAMNGLRQAGTMLWNGGLPVLDDLHTLSYGWYTGTTTMSKEELRKFATENYIKSIKDLKPGLTMVITHCTAPSETFKYTISDLVQIRQGDLLAMTDPAFRKFIENEKIILTTWREVLKRRQEIK